MRLVLVAAAAGLVLLSSGASGQAAKRGFAAAMESAARSAQRMADDQSEMNLARERADLEVETARRLREIQNRPATSRPSPQGGDPEVAEIERRHPQWRRIVTSTAFDRWLRAGPRDISDYCRNTDKAVELSVCIDAFFGPAVPKS